MIKRQLEARGDGRMGRGARRCAAMLAALFLLGGAWRGEALAADAEGSARERTGWTDSLSAGWDKVSGFFSGSSDSDSNRKDEDKGKAQEKEKEKAASSGDDLPGYLASEWDKLTGSLTDALSLRDKQESLPNSSWFGPDKASNAKKINKLLDAALEVLVRGRAGDMRREASRLRDEIPRLRLEADKLRNQRITAPDKSSLPWKTTKATLDKRLAELDQDIQNRERELASLNAHLAEALKELGLELDQAQIDVLLSSVTGDDLLQNTVVFANVKIVVEKLGTLAQNDQNDLEINRRYTGMYLVLNDLLIHTQEELVRKIDGDYKPRLNEIIKEAETIQADARAKSRQKDYTEAQRKSFALNAESNALTIRVGRLYIELLNSQRKGVMDSLKDLRRNRDLAENTYRTVKSSGDLRNLIHSGLAIFDSINGLSMPQLRPFASDAMRREFEEINKRLKR